MNDPGVNHSLTADNILASFPIALQGDASAAALGAITARLLARRPEEISQLRIYPMIDQLPERLLDILAYDFKVDWWDPNYTLAEKWRTLKDSWRVHKMLGTRAAVEMAIRAVHPNTEVLEWFEYEGGKPYHFKLNIDLSDIQCDETRPWRVLERVNFYKSLRSHLEEIVFVMHTVPATLHVGGGTGASASIGVPMEKDVFDFQDTLHIGGAFGAKADVGVPAAADAFHFRAALHTGGVFSGQTELSVPEDISPPSATTILRTGGVCTIISNLSRGD